MKLWLLRPIDEGRSGGPWDPWYDKAFGFVVRAEDEAAARVIADTNAGDEGNHSDVYHGTGNKGHHPHPWRNPELSTCVELTADGEPGLIIVDFKSA